MKAMRTWRSARFRTPQGAERALGLWADRIGGGRSAEPRPDRLRVLGLHAAVTVEQGEGRYYSRATGELAVPAGAAIVVFPEVPHQYWPVGGAWRTRFVVWAGPEADRLAAAGLLPRRRPVLADAAGAVAAAHHRLAAAMAREGVAAALERKAALLDLLLELHRRAEGGGGQDPAVAAAMAWLRTHHARPGLSVAGCAAAVGLSTSHLRRRFSAGAGMGPKEYLTAVRISHAKQLLGRGLAIKQAAAAAGYDDVCHFMRQFRLATGQTAGDWRAGA